MAGTFHPAMVVREYLVENFKFDDTRLKTTGLGKTADATNGGQVEILVYPAPPAAAPEKHAAASH